MVELDLPAIMPSAGPVYESEDWRLVVGTKISDAKYGGYLRSLLTPPARPKVGEVGCLR